MKNARRERRIDRGPVTRDHGEKQASSFHAGERRNDHGKE